MKGVKGPPEDADPHRAHRCTEAPIRDKKVSTSRLNFGLLSGTMEEFFQIALP
jgi:hypothetical protein